jgi:hypothetical protein
MAAEGTFVLADIGGYTTFLTGVGIEHAKEITSFLFNSLLKCNRGRWKVGNVEGDCIFFYREGREPTDELWQHVTRMYEEFRRGIIDVARRSACPCGACSRTGELRLKFIVHAGEYGVQKIGNRQELIGPDVVVAHRLLKNSAPYPEYVLLTKAFAAGDGLPSLPHDDGTETYDDVGTVDRTCIDLAPLRADFEAKSQIFVSESEAQIALTQEIAAPADVVWDALTDIDKAAQWSSVKFEAKQGEKGQLGEVYRCIHGDGSKMIHIVVGMDVEGKRKTEKVWMSPLITDVYFTMEAKELPGGHTMAGAYMTGKHAIPVVSHVIGQIMKFVGKRAMRKDMDGLKAYCEAQVAERTSPGSAVS